MAGSTHAAGLGSRPLLTVDRLGKDLRRTRLACAARAGKEISMTDASRRNRIRKRLADVFLPHEFTKDLRPPFPIKRNICHNLSSLLF